jgi:hypothetical protein
MREMRGAIVDGTFSAYAAEFLRHYRPAGKETGAPSVA